MFPFTDLIENSRTQRYYEIHSVILPVYTVATAVETVCDRAGRVLISDSKSQCTLSVLVLAI